jgi:hypothetical protein
MFGLAPYCRLARLALALLAGWFDRRQADC